MSKGKEPKNPFVNYTTEEVLASEAVTYIIQVGTELFNINGRWVFSKKSAAIYHNKILRELSMQLNSGNKRDRDRAQKALAGLKILPLRVH